MDKTKLRPLLLGAPLLFFIILSLTFAGQAGSLKKSNKTLLERSEQLQKSLEEAQRAISDGDVKNQETIASLKHDNEELQASIKKHTEQLGSIQEEKSYLEEMVINKSKQIELLQKDQASVSTPAETTAPVSRDEEMQRLIEQNRILQEKLDRLYKTTSAKINEINIAKIALEETVSTAKKKIDEEWNTVNLGAVRSEPASVLARTARSEGKVLAINPDHGFVVVDLGRADNLPSDATLEVTKNGEHVATLSVLEIRDVMAACNIKDLRDGQTIEINDPVSILR